MLTIRCYELNCDSEVEVSCNCTSPETYSCEKHLMKHCKSSDKPHNFSSIFIEPVEETKEAILGLLAEEKSKIEGIKANLIASFSQTLCSYQSIFQQVLKEIDSDSTKISCYTEMIWQTKKLSRSEEDTTLNLLALQSNEAFEKAKAIFTAKSNNIELFCDIGRQIDAIIKSFNKEKLNVTSLEMQFELENTLEDHMNFENEEIKIKTELNKYKEAIRNNPNDDKAYHGIGYIFHTEKRNEEAIKYYNHAIKINANNEKYYMNKGLSLWLLQRYEEAIECYNEAIRINPNYALPYTYIGDFFYDKKRYEEALEYYNSAIRADPNKRKYYQDKGKALYKLGRKEEAMECFIEAIRIDPNYAAAANCIGNIFYDEKRYEEALKYYNDAIRISPKAAIYYESKGKALKELGRIEEAQECFNEAAIIENAKKSNQ